jgi:hypothetical protein
MPTTGQPVFIAKSSTFTIFSPYTEDGHVLAEDADRTAVHRAVAGDDAIAEGPIPLQPEVRRPVSRELVQLDERALVEQCSDALAGGLLALGVLLLDCALRAGVHCLVVATAQIGELSRGGVRIERRIFRLDCHPRSLVRARRAQIPR